MGSLKSRWSSLRELRKQMKVLEDFRSMNEWILSCLILHNITIAMGDEWAEYVDDDDDEIIEIYDGRGNINDTGEEFRQERMRYMQI